MTCEMAMKDSVDSFPPIGTLSILDVTGEVR